MPYVGQKPADIISTAVDTVTGKFSGEVDAASLDISGNIDVDGTTNLDVVDIDGTLNVAGETTLQTHLNMGDGDIIKLGDSADLQIYHGGSNSYIQDYGTGQLRIDTNGTDVRITKTDSEYMGKFITDGAVELYHNNSKKFETSTSGVTVTGGITTTTASSIEGGVVFNEASADVDFRVESNGNANALVVDASSDNVLFGQSVANITTNGAYFHLGAANAHLAIGNTQTSNATAIVYLNRQGSDGDLMFFMKGNSTKGSISVSGATVSFNGFSGRHESSGILANTPVGTVVSTIDALDVYPNTSTDVEGNVVTHPEAGQTRGDHAKVEISTSQGDPCVYGVVSGFDGNGKLIVASVGIGSIRVTGACAKGDLLESNGDGTAKVQSDDIVRSKTIGKVTIGNSATDVKLVSCVLYCG